MLSHEIMRAPLKSVPLNASLRENINLVHLSAGPGGIELLLPVIVRNMPDRSFSAFVVRTDYRANGVYKDTPIQVKYGSNRNFAAYLKLLRYTLKNRRAIFHVFNIGPVFLLLLKLGGAKRIIYSIHGTIYWRTKIQKWIYRFIWQLALSQKTVLVANSQHSRNEFVRQIDPNAKIRVLYNPIDLARFCPEGVDFRNDEILVIYSGRLENGKNLQKWIEVAAHVHAAIPKTRFEIYGQGSLSGMLRQQIKDLNAEHYISIKGFRSDIENSYRRADAFLFLSEYESFGNVVVESILCGTPVITSPIPVMKEVFQDFPEFVLNENEDYKQQVVHKLNQLDELKRRAQCAQKTFANRFSSEHHIESLQNIYRGCEK